MSSRRVILREEVWAISGAFAISRGRRTAAKVVMIEIHENGARGRGECVPYRRYGETLEGTVAQLEELRPVIENGTLTRESLQHRLPPGATRNALDCALWDLEAKLADRPVWKLAGLPEPKPLLTAYTISLDEPQVMAEQAAENRSKSLLKLKLGGADDIARVRAVRDAVPEATIIVDANEAWTPVMYAEYGAELARLGVRLVEQPLPADSDHLLDGLGRSVPVCADESCHGVDTLGQVARRYDFINIKLDKTGGLTEALKLAAAAHQAGVGIMVGCMVGTSLGMAPAFFLAGLAQIVDLDGPLLLADDRVPGIDYQESQMQPPPPELWG